MAQFEESFGIIPLQLRVEEWHCLLVLHRQGHWAFPKGHANEGETPRQTAERELHEETGLSVSSYLACESIKEHYYYHFEGELRDKHVTYFLAEVSGTVTLQSAELTDASWVLLSDAASLATHSGSKQSCIAVQQHLERRR